MIDKETFEELFKAQYPALLGLAGSIVKSKSHAEDVVQEVMLDFWNRRKSLKLKGKPEGYLKSAVFRRAMKHWNKESKFQALEKEANVEFQPDRQEESETLLRAALANCVEKLPPRTGLVFRLAKRGGLTHQEVADALEISSKTVENQMMRAFRLLRDCMEPVRKYFETQ